MSTNCIILCGGENSRWKGYRNTQRKHLIEVEGEVLLERTLRQVNALALSSTFVVINEKDLNLYHTHLSVTPQFYSIKPKTAEQTEAYKFLSSRELWNPLGRTIVLLGDVWFSDEAMLEIFGEAEDEWTAFGREGASRFTGHRHGELFAQRFTSFSEHEKNLKLLDEMYLAGTCIRPASGWAHYQLMTGTDPNRHTIGPRFIEIDDFTEDFDTPKDYNAWLQGRSACRNSEQKSSLPRRPVVMSAPKIHRNDPCLCGSGKKFKRCCGQ